MATLVKRIKHSSRGKGKGFGWQVELDMPSVIGTADAALIGGLAATEVVAAIRRNWTSGKNVSGNFVNVDRRGRIGRIIKNLVLKNDDHWVFLREVARAVGSGKAFPRHMVPNADKFYSYKEYLEKNQQGEMIPGEIGKKRVRRNYSIRPDAPGLNASGLMIDTLRGKRRKGRTANINGKATAISDHVELRLPKKRQYAGAFAGGLSQARADRMTETFRDMPQTNALLEQSANWQQFGEVSTSLFVAARLILMAVRFIGSV